MYSASSFRVSSPLIWLLLWKLQQCSHLLMANVPVLDAILAARARELPHLPQHVWLGSWVPGDTDGGPTSVAEPPTFCSADFRVWKLTFGWKLFAQEWKVQTDHSISGWNRVFNLNSSTVFVGWQSHLLSIDSQFLLVHLLILGGSPHFFVIPHSSSGGRRFMHMWGKNTFRRMLILDERFETTMVPSINSTASNFLLILEESSYMHPKMNRSNTKPRFCVQCT